MIIVEGSGYDGLIFIYSDVNVCTYYIADVWVYSKLDSLDSMYYSIKKNSRLDIANKSNGNLYFC